MGIGCAILVCVGGLKVVSLAKEMRRDRPCGKPSKAFKEYCKKR